MSRKKAFGGRQHSARALLASPELRPQARVASDEKERSGAKGGIKKKGGILGRRKKIEEKEAGHFGSPKKKDGQGLDSERTVRRQGRRTPSATWPPTNLSGRFNRDKHGFLDYGAASGSRSIGWGGLRTDQKTGFENHWTGENYLFPVPPLEATEGERLKKHL